MVGDREMNREEIITTLLTQFRENANHLSDEDLEKLAKGDLVISLVQAVGDEAGGALSLASAAPRSSTMTSSTSTSTTLASATTATAPSSGTRLR